MDTINKINVFRGKKIRKVIFQNEWYFSVVDIVDSLIESSVPKRYWSDLKIKIKKEGQNQLYDFIVPLKIVGSDGKKYLTDCANTETIFRIIQSIPSPKAEPFKMWLAKVGYERVQEIEDPELATKRTRALYKAKGYPDSWIEKRMRGIEVRETLTSEWKKRDVGGDIEYAILTAEISKATFGMTPKEYKEFKGLERENLRDHMNDLELIFSMLGEASTTEIAKNRDAQGFGENKKAAQEGGEIAGDARQKLEIKSGKPVSVSNNFIDQKPNKKLN